MTLNCNWVKNNLCYINDANFSQTSQLKEHLSSCSACHKIYEEDLQLAQMLNKQVAVPSTLRPSLMAEFRKQQVQAKHFDKWQYLVAASLLLAGVIYITIHFITRHPLTTNEVVITANKNQDPEQVVCSAVVKEGQEVIVKAHNPSYTSVEEVEASESYHEENWQTVSIVYDHKSYTNSTSTIIKVRNH